MPSYIWLDYENRIWFGILLRDIDQEVVDGKNYLLTYLEREWLISEFQCRELGTVRKETTLTYSPSDLFKLLSACFEDMTYRQLQKLTLRAVNRYVMEPLTADLKFAQPYCLSILHVSTPMPAVNSVALDVSFARLLRNEARKGEEREHGEEDSWRSCGFCGQGTSKAAWCDSRADNQ